MEFEKKKKGMVGEKHFMFLHSEMSKKYAKMLCKYLPFGILLLKEEEEEDDYDYDGGDDNNDNDNVLWW